MGVHPRSEAERPPFQQQLTRLKRELNVSEDKDLSASDLRELVKRYKRVIKQRCKAVFPQDVNEQLWGAIGAVFKS